MLLTQIWCWFVTLLCCGKLSIVWNWFPPIEFGYFSCSLYLVTKIFQFLQHLKLSSKNFFKMNIQFETNLTRICFLFIHKVSRNVLRLKNAGNKRKMNKSRRTRGICQPEDPRRVKSQDFQDFFLHFGINLLMFPDSKKFKNKLKHVKRYWKHSLYLSLLVS